MVKAPRFYWEIMGVVLFLLALCVGSMWYGGIQSQLHKNEVEEISKGIESDKALIKKLTLQRDECRMAKKIDD